jgi:cytochrome P450
MDLPPGPRAPALWQTLGWMARPGAFMAGAHARFGDPVTIRTYWTEEPMVLFSSPDAVRDVFRLDPRIAPAGQSWEFLRPFAGPHSILLLDGDEHLRERRLLQGPFHGERMRAFAPMIASLAREELGAWNGRIVTLERFREMMLSSILRIVFGSHDVAETRALRDAIEGALASVRTLPRMLAMAVVMKDLGDWSPWGRFRLAVERFDALLYEVLARRRVDPPAEDSVLRMLMESRDEDGRAPSDRRLRDQLVALLMGGHDSSAAALAWGFERLARHPGVVERLRSGEPAYVDAVVKEVLRARPGITIAPRLLLQDARIGGVEVPAGVQVAACLWLAMRREDLWPGAAEFRPERWLAEDAPASAFSWIPFGGGVRRCAGAPFAEMELREVLRVAFCELGLNVAPVRPEGERARRSLLVVVPERGGEVVVSRAPG